MTGPAVVITGVGRDRVGIVAELTQILYDHGCNLLDSSMTLLRGEFALITMARLPESLTITKLSDDLKRLENKLGLTIHVRELQEDELKEVGGNGASYMISVYGADHPGIVAGITRKVAELGLNITDVQTKYTGSESNPIFVMLIEATAPSGSTEQGVRAGLQEISKQLKVDVSVQAVESFEL